MSKLAVLKTAGKTALRWMCTHKKAILIAVGTASTTGAVVIATIQSPKAKKALEELPAPQEDATKVDILMEKVKTVAPMMWPVPVLTATGIGCFMYVTHISAKEVTRAVSDGLAWKQAYNELAHIHNDYVFANRKISGEENHEKVMQEVQDNRLKRLGPNTMIVNTGKGDEIFYDTLSGQFFRSNATYISNAAMAFATDMHNAKLPNPDAINGFGTAEEWFENYLLVNAGTICADYGWYDENIDGFNTKYNPFRIYITEQFVTAPDGNPARIIDYDNLPIEP